MQTHLSEWQTFYEIVGSSSAALIGIQFVVITLVSNLRQRPSSAVLGAFATPTVVHLVGALLISAVMSAPWRSLFPVIVVVALSGLAGIFYCVIVARRALRQTDYKPVWEDLTWHELLPGGAYATLGVASAFLRADTESSSFAIAGAALALLLIGIHNAWDTVTHLVAERGKSGP